MLLGVRWVRKRVAEMVVHSGGLERDPGRRISQARKVVGVERKGRKRGGRAVWSLRGVDEHAGGSSTSWRARVAKQLRG